MEAAERQRDKAGTRVTHRNLFNNCPLPACLLKRHSVLTLTLFTFILVTSPFGLPFSFLNKLAVCVSGPVLVPF